MKVARIKSVEGHEYLTNVTDAEALSKLEGVDLVEIVEMEPEDFWRTPATENSRRFFAPIAEVSDDVRR